ncbi:DUF805 domain-containing protein [Thioclava pacifica]|uniref:GYF domain-containing protein n=1 Tax=Thioclava pacifica DSM 10166 TaxID=1353537 RepID=A0A074JA66_9RHOB|nr:DUF805 domain-containing protein [Thioclava pacifica]KEO52725.1 hypothetical protein TP2_07225 [Thioclava pacifica DSM 10166]
MAQDWFYADGQAPTGPHTSEQIEDMIRAGRIKPDTLVWHEGMAGWEPAADHFFKTRVEGDDTAKDDLSQNYAHPGVDHGGATNYAARVAQRHQAEGKLETNDPRAYADASIETERAKRGIGPDGLYIEAPSRGPIEAVKVCFRKYATFKGRASRSEYWWFILFVAIASVIGEFAEGAMGSDGAAINGVIAIATFMPSISAQVRRIHDTNRSGWWVGGYWLLSSGGGAYIGYLAWETGAVATPSGGVAMMALLSLWGIAMLIYSLTLFVFSVRRGTYGKNDYG